MASICVIIFVVILGTLVGQNRGQKMSGEFELAYQEKFPWNVIVKYIDSAHNKSSKLGYIINHNWILTTAHGLEVKHQQVIVQFGCPFTRDYRGRSVKAVHIHTNYSPETGHNDLALLQTHLAMKFNVCVNKINLPLQPNYMPDPAALRATFISYYHHRLVHPYRIFWTQANIITADECSGRGHGNHFAHEHHICERLNRTIHDRWNPVQNLIEYNGERVREVVLIGIRTFHENNCERKVTCKDHPRKFLKITSFTKWINKIIQ